MTAGTACVPGHNSAGNQVLVKCLRSGGAPRPPLLASKLAKGQEVVGVFLWAWSWVQMGCVWCQVGSPHCQGPHGTGSRWSHAAAGWVVASFHWEGRFMPPWWPLRASQGSLPTPCPTRPGVPAELHAALAPLAAWGRRRREALPPLGLAGYK